MSVGERAKPKYIKPVVRHVVGDPDHVYESAISDLEAARQQLAALTEELDKAVNAGIEEAALRSGFEARCAALTEERGKLADQLVAERLRSEALQSSIDNATEHIRFMKRQADTRQSTIEMLARDVHAAEADLAALRSGLLKLREYLQHKADCDFLRGACRCSARAYPHKISDDCQPVNCTCGLTDTLSALSTIPRTE